MVSSTFVVQTQRSSIHNRANCSAIRLRATVPGLVQVRHRGSRARGPGVRRAAGRRASCASALISSNTAPAIGGQARADQRRDLALQRVDARIGMRPAVRQRRRRRRRRGARASRRAPAAASPAESAAGWPAESARRDRPDRARRSCRADRSSRRASATGETRRTSAPASRRRRGTARPPRGNRRACAPCRAAPARASSTDSTALVTNSAAGGAQPRQQIAMLQQVLDLDRDVVGHRRDAPRAAPRRSASRASGR